MRQQCMIMARNNSTPVTFWLSMPVIQLVQWIRTGNRITKEQNGE